MPYKNKEEQKAYAQKHYQANKEKVRKRSRDRKRRIRKWVSEYKSERGCLQCPENHPACLHFHHIDPKTKICNISSMITDKADISLIEEEIKKCVLLCANCHAKEHYDGVSI